MITKLRLQHKMTSQIYQHLTYNVSDFILVTDDDQEIPLSEFLAKVERLLKKFEEKEDKPFDRSGAV